MKGKLAIGLLAGLGMSLSATCQAQSAWDAVGDFDVNANPIAPGPTTGKSLGAQRGIP